MPYILAMIGDSSEVCRWGRKYGRSLSIRSYAECMEVRNRRKYVFIHSCGDVDELFDDLIEIGVDCFNPFQPEVMNIFLIEQYRDRLSFHGGLSTQRTLPYGTPQDVVRNKAPYRYGTSRRIYLWPRSRCGRGCSSSQHAGFY